MNVVILATGLLAHGKRASVHGVATDVAAPRNDAPVAGTDVALIDASKIRKIR
jgi:hypothetical protein